MPRFVLLALTLLTLFAPTVPADPSGTPLAALDTGDRSSNRPASLITARAILAPALTLGTTPTALGPLDDLTAQPPLLTTTLSYAGDNGVSASITGTWRAEYHLDHPHNVPWGPPGNRVAFENNSISEGYLGFAGRVGWVRFGRQPVSLGPSRLSNLQVSQTVPFLDAIAYGVSLGRWSLTQAIATLENRAGIDDLSIPFARTGYDFGISTILLSTRRFHWSAPRVRLGIGAQAILTRDYNAFQLGDVLPVFSVHNAEPGKNNLFITFDGEVDLSDALSAYAIVGLDDINAGVAGVTDDAIPTIWAAIAGVRFDPARDPRALTLDAEIGYTHELWGSFEDTHPLSRSLYRLRADGGFLVMPLTSPYGPAKTWLRAVASVPILDSLTIAPDLLVLAGDPAIDLVSLEYTALAPSWRFMLARLRVAATWQPVPALSATIAPAVDLTVGAPKLRLAISGRWLYELAIERGGAPASAPAP